MSPIVFNSGFLITLIMAFVLQRPETLFFGSVVCAGYAISRMNFSRVNWGELFVVLAAILICFFSTLSFNHGLSPIFYLFSTLFAFYAAKNFNNCTLRQICICLRIVFWLAIFAIGYVLLKYWDFPEPFGEVVPGSSTNGIPSYLIIIQIALSLAVFLESKRFPIISAAFTLAVAIFGLGRGSIVIAGMILLSSFVVNFSLKKITIFARLEILFLVFFAIFMVLLVFGFYFDIQAFVDEMVGQTKFREGFFDPYREEIFSQYLSKLDWFSLLFGADYSGTVIADQYDGNPHISYVRTHAYYGFFGLVLVVFSLLLILIAKKNFVYKFVFLIFISFSLMRALSEPLLFPTLLDFFYFLYFFMFFKHAPSEVSKI